MKAEDIRKMPIDKIEDELDEVRERLMRMRFQIATGELKDQNQPRMLRHDIARMSTILTEKRAEAAKPAENTETKAEGAK
jgi:large subunit ribosomal protein L29